VQTSYRDSDYQSDILRKFDFQYCNYCIFNISPKFSNVLFTIFLPFTHTPLTSRISRILRVCGRETEEQRRVIAPLRSIGLPAVLRLRQRFFVKKGPRARYYPIVGRVTRTHACLSVHAEQRQPRVKNGALGEPARDAAMRFGTFGVSNRIAGKSVPEN